MASKIGPRASAQSPSGARGRQAAGRYWRPALPRRTIAGSNGSSPMHRRDALRLLVTTAVPALAGLSPARLGAVGRSAHRTGRALQVLDAHQSATLLAIAEHIIPATDTPGARAARVDAFADVILAERYDDRERARFLAGLADVDARARAATGRPFLEATAEQQVAVLTALDGAAL